MYKTKPTLAIYGIQDRKIYEHPFYVHDHNLALMQNGKVLHFLQQERISGKKRDNTLHIDLKSILKEKKLLGKDFDLVFVDNVVGRTFLTQDGEARFEAPLKEFLAYEPELGKCWWFGKEKEGYALNHELAHMFSCLPFFGNFKDNSLLVHFDGGASMSNFSACTFHKGRLKWEEYNWDLKPFSTIYNANALVFSIIGAKLADQNSVPGKFMGFAGWGSYRPEMEDWLVENNFFQDIWGQTSEFLKSLLIDWGIELKSFDQNAKFIRDIAATLQQMFINKILEKLKHLKEATGAENLYYTGGSALNIVANTAIIKSKLFKNVFIPPCAEDSGLALGAAAYVEWLKHEKVEKHSPFLNNWNIENYVEKITTDDIPKIAEELSKGNIIGICNGFGEAGPRALGNRSILTLANSKKRAKKLSEEIKGREWYRPLAPISLEKNTKYFTGENTVHPLSKYMLLDFPILPEKQKEIEGVVHANGTARFQTIFDKKDNPFMYELLKLLDEKYEIKVLINTSFNSKGKPIVNTEEDALQAASQMKLDGLVLNGNFQKL